MERTTHCDNHRTSNTNNNNNNNNNINNVIIPQPLITKETIYLFKMQQHSYSLQEKDKKNHILFLNAYIFLPYVTNTQTQPTPTKNIIGTKDDDPVLPSGYQHAHHEPLDIRQTQQEPPFAVPADTLYILSTRGQARSGADMGRVGVTGKRGRKRVVVKDEEGERKGRRVGR